MSRVIATIIGWMAFVCIVQAQEIQWATEVVSFSSEKSPKAFGANQLLGKPNRYPNPSFSTCAWSPEYSEARVSEYVHVAFASPVVAKQIVIVENNNSGHITAIYVYDSNNKEKMVYNRSGTATAGAGRLFVVGIKDNTLPIKAVKVLFDQPERLNTYQIDAIGITTGSGPVLLEINTIDDPLNNKAESLGNAVNSAFDEVYPVISPDGKTLYFDRKVHPDNIGTQKNDDIWLSRFTGAGWTSAENIGPPLNNENHNFICSISPDGNSALVGNSYLPAAAQGTGVSMARKTESGWALPQPVKINAFQNLNQYNEFSLSADGAVLLMSLETSSGNGLLDLYVSFRQSNNTYSQPMSLGRQLNTAGMEMTPFLAADNKTLYFSSNGFPGFGNQDIFMTRRLDNSWTNWSEPQNMGSEVNTPEWDVYYSIDARGEYAYFSSSKTTGTNLDIFRIKLPPQAQPENIMWLKGTVFDRTTTLPINAEIEIQTTTDSVLSGFTNASISSGYSLILQQFGSYRIHIGASGYYVTDTIITIDSLGSFNEVIRNFSLIPKKAGVIIEMENILFKVNSSVLEDTSFAEIDKVLKFLTANPGVAIEIRGHTNGLCDDDYCKTLSTRRAKAVVDYLVKNGVDKDRLSYIGLGKTMPIADNNTVAGRQKNQRVEFMITKTD